MVNWNEFLVDVLIVDQSILVLFAVFSNGFGVEFEPIYELIGIENASPHRQHAAVWWESLGWEEGTSS